jgi:bifunctional dethiobiotin synthetase / adenosylmethionine---8-amino-7-oxononanoate aminotransferase
LSLSAAYASGRYGHVMFPECTHEPALAVSESLLSTVGRPWADRVFFSDNGSTAVEVALKMGLRASELEMGNRNGNAKDERTENNLEVLGINGGYHGDTIGAMDACAPNVFNEQVGW